MNISIDFYPLISVIVPVYNTVKYVNKCINSIINQTYKNLQIILVDDGSTDNSGGVCDDYAKMDSRIIVIHEENQGVSKARNNAIDIMNGKYLVFVDSDDWLPDDGIMNLYEALLYNEAEYVVGRMNYILPFRNGHDNKIYDMVIHSIGEGNYVLSPFG